jgi:hypothetical protein
MREVAGPFPPHLSLETSRSTLLLVRSSVRHRRRTQLRSFSPYRWSRNPSTVERWACGECRSWYRVEAFGSGSTCRRAISLVRPPSLPGGRSPGSCVTRSYAARTAAPPAQQVFGRGGGASTGKLDIVDGAQLHRRSNCRGVVTTRVIHPASRRDTGEKGLSKHGDIP